MPSNNGQRRRNERRTTAITKFEEALERRNREIQKYKKGDEAFKEIGSTISNLQRHIEKTKAKL